MPSFIPPDFQPRKEDYRAVAFIPLQWIDMETPKFIHYWKDRQEMKHKAARKSNWFAAWRNWIRKSWDSKEARFWEQYRHQRQDTGGLKTDLFDVDKINSGDRIANSRGSYPQQAGCDSRPRSQINGSAITDGKDDCNCAERLPTHRQGVCSRATMPAAAATMSFEEAQEELKRMGIIK